jgi:predicted membrane-bound spermidine synthase
MARSVLFSGCLQRSQDKPCVTSGNTSPSLYFALFAVSGFAGLMYESIWTHYLKLFLGHAAYAQTLVLAIFMGGMALGSWLAGAY